ncbi:head decoration protein [Lichenihabitans sp. PAMC28606]|uniref:head decoration protein n=1 Tax=Lichenihabitans sp. PAMC28606 TaxID=2880932 RepID=UPI001D0B1F5A|nr:head decoration protein [Lichenihabitans sp. PAMC28606]UDL95500.1 head decoration protein [Lichenihabitans sp. PAMC28606]
MTTLPDPAYALTSLLADETPLPHRTITLAAGATPLPRGAVLGMIGVGTATSTVKASGANTGNGTLVLDPTTPVLANAKPGLYQVRFTSPTAYSVTDPAGGSLGPGATGTAFADRLKFLATAGGTAFVAGDGFDIALTDGGSKYVLSVAAAVDGSQVPQLILAYDIPASVSDVPCAAYYMGGFVAEKLTYGTGHSAATVEAALRAVSSPIVIKSVGVIAYPT